MASVAGDDKRLLEPVRVFAQEPAELDLVFLHIAKIQPHAASSLMSKLAADFPLTGLQHLKRIRKSASGCLDIVLGVAHPVKPVSNDRHILKQDGGLLSEQDFEPMSAPLSSFAREKGLEDLGIGAAARKPASSRTQWAEWCKLWPISWLAPSVPAADTVIGLTAADVKRMHGWMQKALQEAQLAEQGGFTANAAIVVDPRSDEVVAIGRDSTHLSPLQHAVMVAVDAVAALNVAGWPGEAQPDELDANIPGKLQRPESASDVSGARPAQPVPGLAKVAEPLASKAGRPYLCTGYDCFVVEEPCAMCAMALVHSRVRRVHYCKQDSKHGALGGAFKLHAEKSLNHHYAVYQIQLSPANTDSV